MDFKRSNHDSIEIDVWLVDRIPVNLSFDDIRPNLNRFGELSTALFSQLSIYEGSVSRYDCFIIIYNKFTQF